MEFTHLHVHTEYSLLDGSNKIKEYVARVKELGMDSAAITDHGVMYGVIDFYRAARAEGINPILGCEVYVAPGSRFDREAGSGEDRYYHLVLLAENNQGYANLMKIVSKGFTEGFYYKPRVDLAVLKEYHEGIIALSACLAGEVARYLQRGMYEDAKAAALRYQDIFGKGNFFLELQDHGIPAQRLVNQELLRMHEETGIDLVATNDVHYTRAEDADPHDILLCLQTNKKLADEDRMRYEGGQYYVKSPEEMAELFPYALEALENTHKIAQRCHVEIEFGVTKLPRFDVPDGLTSWEYLNKLCFEGLEERYQPVTEELKARLNYELSTIKNMGYVDYFLIVWDFIKYARDHDIMEEIIRQGILYEPGTDFKYSNSGYYLLANILRKIHKKAYFEILDEEIIRPLGLLVSASGIISDSDEALPYEKNAVGEWVEVPDFYFLNVMGVGDILSSPENINLFLHALFTGKLISKEHLQIMKPYGDDRHGRGMMYMPYHEHKYYGHTGDTFGVHSIGVYNEQEDISIAVSVNGSTIPFSEFLLGIFDSIYGK